MVADISNSADDHHQRIAWMALALLLLLRIPYTIFIIYFLPIENQLGGAIYEVGTYLLTAFLIWWERDRLTHFHMDGLVLSLFIVFRPLQTLILRYWRVDSPVAFPHPFACVMWITSISLCLALLKSGYKPPRLAWKTWRWLALGLIAGLGVSMAEHWRTFSATLAANPHTDALAVGLLSSSSLTILYHIGFAPINEEPLFRGFLWGSLRQFKWREGWIWLFQAVVFTLAHVYFAAQYPVRFWAFIPFAGLLLGWLTWRSRSLAPAILAHGLINGSVYILAIVLLPLL